MTGQKKISISVPRRFIFCFILTSFLCSFSISLHAQKPGEGVANLVDIRDLGDLFRQVLHKAPDTSKMAKKRKAAILPSIGYNPSFGFIIGAKVSAIKQLGSDENTALSSFGLEFIYSTKGVITVQSRHNIFTKENKWNFQGNWQFSKYLIADYGIGTGNKNYPTESDSTFLIRFSFIRLTEKLYRKIGKDLYAGGGISFDIRTNINDELLDSLKSSPHYRYSLRNGFDPKKYSANGLMLSLQYNTREHPIRSYGGIYADLNLRFNQTWLGSTKNAIQVFYDFRKYYSLSKKNPEHVLAFWHWASYKLDGLVPYLELPATGYDTYNRSGRAYTIGRFKGPNFAYFESEYRFPITPNKFISGVIFVNTETASDDHGKKIFQYWETAIGGGLRILMQKQSRSTLCIDYAKGKYGSGGFFFGLNEAF